MQLCGNGGKERHTRHTHAAGMARWLVLPISYNEGKRHRAFLP